MYVQTLNIFVKISKPYGFYFIITSTHTQRSEHYLKKKKGKGHKLFSLKEKLFASFSSKQNHFKLTANLVLKLFQIFCLFQVYRIPRNKFHRNYQPPLLYTRRDRYVRGHILTSSIYIGQ